MKKVLIAGAALMLAGGIVAPVFAADATPGVVITGDARARYFYKDEHYFDNFGNTVNANVNSQTNMDSRVRFDLTGTSAGGAYVKGRIRLMESLMGTMASDVGEINSLNQNDIWADKAYFGVPFTKDFTLEVGKYRSTYGPLPATLNFFYDDVILTGARGIAKFGNIEVNPFFEYMSEAQNLGTGPTSANNTPGGSGSSGILPNGNTASTLSDQKRDHDSIRMGGHIKAKINPDWIVGGMAGYQTDARNEVPPTATTSGIQSNDGLFGSVYTSGKVGAFGIVGEVGVTAAKLNGFNSWYEDYNNIVNDAIGSKDTGWGGYVFPNFTMGKFNIGLNVGTTQDGFTPDRAFGFVMLGSTDNSVITAVQLGNGGDFIWAGLVPSYAFSDSLKLTGNLVYASVNPWNQTLEGPGFKQGVNQRGLDNAWELSAVLQYTIVKGADLFFAVGYLDPSMQWVNENPATVAAVERVTPLKEDSVLGAYTRFELKF